MSLFLWASVAVLLCAGALCGLARLYYRHGQAVGITAVLLAGGIPALPFLAVAVYLAWVVQRRRVATP